MSRTCPDTEDGAIRTLGSLSSHDMTGATAKPDPEVGGAWLVTHATGKSIVYIDRLDFEDVD